MEPIRVQYHWTERTLWQLLHRLYPTMKYLATILCIAGIATIAIGLFPGHRSADFLPFIVIGLTVVGIVVGGTLRQAVRIRKAARSKQVIRYEFTDAGMKIAVGGTTHHVAWTAVTNVREHAEFFFFYFESRVAHWLPKGAFASDADLQRFRKLVSQKVPRKTK
jgi:hypothetical protein